MEGMKDVKSHGSVGDGREIGVIFIDLPLMITMVLDLSPLKIRPVYLRAIVKQKSKVPAPQIVDDIMFSTSMKALIGRKDIYLSETEVWWLPKSIVELYSYQLRKNYTQSATGGAYANWWVSPDKKIG